MRKIREILRLKHERKLSNRQISAATAVGRETVSKYLRRAEAAGLTWEAACDFTDVEVESLLFEQIGRNEPVVRAPIDFDWVHMELRRAGVTRQLLWTEYQEVVCARDRKRRPYQYSQFCDLYDEYRAKLQPSMRQVHRAGEKAFVDYSGKKPRIVDATTGSATEVELFVMVLGASNYTYAEATRTQRLGDFVGSTVRGLEYFGAVPEILVPDQLKSAVRKADRMEPEINATYAELAQHYGTAVVPARPRKPKDKAKVEGGVLVAQRWILACLRNRQFFTLEELNAAIVELLEKLNDKPFQKLEGCRRSTFEKLDRPAMKPLPPRRYEVGEWKLEVGVNIDYHFQYDHHYYSAPCALVNAKVDVRATAMVVEAWHAGERVASHARSYGPKGLAVTAEEHRPRSHREWGNWPPERLIGWGQRTGPNTAGVIAAIFDASGHPEGGRRACLGLMRMGERYGAERLEAASARAMAIQNPTYKSVQAILKTGLDKEVGRPQVQPMTVAHENIRGGAYFDREEVDRPATPEEIEARYLEEERTSIRKEPRVLPDPGPTRAGDAPQNVKTGALACASKSVSKDGSTGTLPAMLGRLRGLWSGPRTPPQGHYPGRCHLGGKDSDCCEHGEVSGATKRECMTIANNEERAVLEEMNRTDPRGWALDFGIESGSWMMAMGRPRGLS